MSTETRIGPVLVVDDDHTIIEYINLALLDDGFNCVGATSGEEAARMVVEAKPSLILLDISMPIMDGKEFCRWLRSSGHLHIPVIVMTAGQNAARTCDEIGAQTYLAKPFDLVDLQACVRKWATS